MKIDQLRYLCSLKETKSFSKTAQIFFTSHQAVSQSIKRLEKELSTTLLTRSAIGVALTESGEITASRAANILSEFDLLETELLPFTDKKLPKKEKVILTIYTLTRFNNSIFLDFVDQFQQDNPEVIIVIRNEPSKTILEKTSFNEYSLGLNILATDSALYSDMFKKSLSKNNLSYHLLATKPLFFVTHKDSTLAKLDYMSQEKFSEIPAIIFNYTGHLTQEIKNTLNSNSNIFIDSYEAHKRYIKTKKASGLYTLDEVKYLFGGDKNIVAIPFDSEVTLHFILLYNNTVQLHPLLEKFIDEYKAQFYQG